MPNAATAACRASIGWPVSGRHFIRSMIRYFTRRWLRKSRSKRAISSRVGSLPHKSKYATSSYVLLSARTSMGIPQYSRMPFCPSMKPTRDSMIGTPSSPGTNFSMVDLSLVHRHSLVSPISPGHIPQGSPLQAGGKAFLWQDTNCEGRRRSLRISSQASAHASKLFRSTHLLGKRREVEIITPGRDFAATDLKHTSDRQFDLLGPHDKAIDPLIHDGVPGGGGVLDVEIDGVSVLHERLDELADGSLAHARLHRDVVVEAVIGQIAQDLVDVLPRPRLTEIGNEFFVFRAHEKNPPFFSVWPCRRGRALRTPLLSGNALSLASL